MISNFKIVSSVFLAVSEDKGGISVGWCYRQWCLSGGNVVPPLEINDTVFGFFW